MALIAARGNVFIAEPVSGRVVPAAPMICPLNRPTQRPEDLPCAAANGKAKFADFCQSSARAGTTIDCRMGGSCDTVCRTRLQRVLSVETSRQRRNGNTSCPNSPAGTTVLVQN